MKALLIAEKASLAKAVQTAYRNNGFVDQIDFFSLHGHIMSLYDPGMYKPEWVNWNLENLPMIPEQFKYRVFDQKLFDELINRLKNNHYDYLINCCDPDREGQHIFYSIYDSIHCSLPVKRMWHNDLSDKELIRALNQMEDDLNTDRLVHLKQASKLRAQMDWLVGMNASRIVTIKRRSLTRLGRVMTPTFKILCDRELAIRSFNSQSSYGIEAIYSQDFKGKLVGLNKEGKQEILYYPSKEEADLKIIQLSEQGIVKSVEKKQVKENPPQLPSLADIQAECNREFGFTLDKTLDLVQSLYEKKLVSYPRTDCCYITNEVAKDFEKILKAFAPTKSIGPFIYQINKETIDGVRRNKDYVNDSKVTAHYALIPTGLLSNGLSEDEKKVFEMICKRFVCIFLPAYSCQKTKVLINHQGECFQANGSIVLDKGYKQLLGFNVKDEIIPDLEEGQVLTASKFEAVEHTTKAPSRFTDASLLNAMINAANYIQNKELSEILKGDAKVKDSGGIGTPATRAAIVEKIVQPITTKEGKQFYLAYRKGKYFYVTEEGLDLMDSLQGFDIISPELTATWEKYLKEIEEGNLKWESFVRSMNQYTRDMANQMINSEYHRVIGTFLKCKCPVCGARMKAMNSFYICENYKKEGNTCLFNIPMTINEANISEKMVEEICNGNMTKSMKMKSPKTGNTFYAGLFFNPQSQRVEFKFDEFLPEKCKCPVCGARLKSMKSFYICENYKKEENTCIFNLPKKISDANISEKMVEEICRGKTTKAVKMKSPKTGNYFYAGLFFNPQTQKIEFQFEDGHPTKYNCPGCGEKLLKKSGKNGDYLACPNMDFNLSYMIAGRKMKESEIKELFEKRELKCDGFISKSGKEFSSKLIFENNKVTFYFGKKAEEVSQNPEKAEDINEKN